VYAGSAQGSRIMPTYETTDLKVNIDFECHIEGDKEKPVVKYQATVLFSSLEKLLEAGGESVKRICQTHARKGNFPEGRRVLVDENGKFTKTSEEKAVDAINDANEAELEAMMALAKAKLAALKNATKTA
jgi:hypothetical protein